MENGFMVLVFDRAIRCPYGRRDSEYEHWLWTLDVTGDTSRCDVRSAIERERHHSARASSIQMERPNPDDRALGVHAFVPLRF